jgi:hypothetical protein
MSGSALRDVQDYKREAQLQQSAEYQRLNRCSYYMDSMGSAIRTEMGRSKRMPSADDAKV